MELIAGYERAINRMDDETSCDPAHVFYGARNATQPAKPLPYFDVFVRVGTRLFLKLLPIPSYAMCPHRKMR